LPLRKYPPAINAYPEWNDLVNFLGGPTQENHITSVHIKEYGSNNALFSNKGRGINLAAGDNVTNLAFAEPDNEYIILLIVTGSAATVRVVAKTTTSFTLNATSATTVDWILIR
jgi:hypothetical protein